MDITKMEILMHTLYEEHRKKREATFRSPKSTSTPAEGVVAESSISATTPVEITVSQAVDSPLASPSEVTGASSADQSAVGVTTTSTVRPTDPAKTKSTDGSEDKGSGLNGNSTTEGQISKEKGHVANAEEVKKDADVEPSPEPANAHIGYTCCGCKGSIAGSRFRCLECVPPMPISSNFLAPFLTHMYVTASFVVDMVDLTCARIA